MNTDEEKFWDRVDKKEDNECWIWRGQKIPSGYGYFWYKGTKTTAHRVSYMLNFDEIIPNEMEVCHSCNNRGCVNPKHLYIGTHQDNIKYRDEQGRTPKSENHYSAIFTREKVDEIRRKYIIDKNITMRELGKEYSVAEDVIENIINNKTYKDDNYTVPTYKSGKEGEHNSHAKLTWEIVDDIRKRYRKGEMVNNLAEEYKVDRHSVSNIIHNRTWIMEEKDIGNKDEQKSLLDY